MKNIKNFEQFGESLNEGLISWMKRKFNPKEMDNVIGDIIDHIESEFDIDNLKMKDFKSFKYVTKKDDVIFVDYVSPYLKINNEDVSDYVDVYYIYKLFNFFKKKFDNTEKEKINKRKEEKNKKISKLKSDLSRKYNNDQEEHYY